VSHGTIRATVALGPAASREAIEAACLAEPSISISGFVSAHSQEVSALDDVQHDAQIVACADESGEPLAFISGAVGERPARPVVVVYQGSANGFVSQALHAGAADLINAPVDTGAAGNEALGREIAFALEKAIARGPVAPAPAPAPASTAQGKVIAVLGPKGGTGKTLTSCNLAGALASSGASVVVVDLDLQFGDVGLALGLRPDQTIYELATAGGSLDAEKVEHFLQIHESGIRALLAPRRPDHAGAVTVEFVRALFDTLRDMADFVIVDTPPGFTPEVIAAIDRSSAVCVVAMLDALSLKNTKLALETLDLMEYDPGSISIVLNRADSRVGVTIDDVTELLGRQPDIRVPSHRDITRSVNEAMPIVLSGGNAEARKAFQTLGATYLTDPARTPEAQTATTTPTKRRRLFGRRRKDR
jgi:pilus assembly protein CpaE